ncbi:MAG: tyrosine protein kinase, partial [Tannerella sp.]|nr:tyrosine protein kinase [Tannerella sp.]
MENKDTESLGLKTVIVRYLHQWKLFVAAFFLSLIPAVLYLVFYPQTFDFIACIQIQEDKDVSVSGLGMGEAAGLMRSFGIGGSGVGVNIEDELSILTSNRLFSAMVLDLGLHVEYTRPYSFYKMYRDAPLKLSPDSASMAGLDSEYRFTVSVSGGNVTVKAKNKAGGWKEQFTFTSLPARIKAKNADFTLDFDNGASIDRDFKLKIKCMPVSWVAEQLAGDFLIED